MDKKIEMELNESNYGPFLPFLIREDITDVDFNGRQLWIKSVNGKRALVDNPGVTNEFIDQFSHRIANLVNQPFNQTYSLLEAETDCLRVSVMHESIAISGRSLSIRKSFPKMRMNEKQMIDTGYCDVEILNFLKNCVYAHMNIVFCGEPGAGKTECAKFFSSYIPANERVITIEDNAELHYEQIHPGRDSVALRVDSQHFTYEQAIKSSLRQNPAWIMLSEARSREVKYLLECWSTGVSGFTTIHTDDVRKIPDRIQNMMEISREAQRLENQIFEFVRIGVLIRSRNVNSSQKGRYIDQVGIFYRENGQNEISLFVQDGQIRDRRLPDSVQRTMERAGISEPLGGCTWNKES